ncbi:hypothetical protein ACFQGA_02465 [Marinobacter koreensis]
MPDPDQGFVAHQFLVRRAEYGLVDRLEIVAFDKIRHDGGSSAPVFTP